MQGFFLEQLTDPHVELRQQLLEGVTPPPKRPYAEAIHLRSVDGSDRLRDALDSSLSRFGLAVIQLDEPLTDDRFCILGNLMGTPILETHPTVQAYVAQNVILNLISDHQHTLDVGRQPFSAHYLALHTESSARPIAQQPRLLVLMCMDPGDEATTAQTVLVPMTDVACQLDARDLELLSQTRYMSCIDAPAIVRAVGSRHVFCFRELLSQPLQWTCEHPEASVETVNAAFRRLLTAMYAPGIAFGIAWSRALLVVFDNTFYFHGRTMAAGGASARRRHLKRQRIMAPAGPTA